MPCYGGSCCDFCGLEIGTGNYTYFSDAATKTKLRLIIRDSIFFSWLDSSEILTERGKICDNLTNETIYVMEDINDHFKKYTNIKLHWVDNIKYYEGVFLHAFCRIYIEKRKPLWTRKQLFQILKKDREPYAVSDEQVHLFQGMEWSGVPMWRAVNPRYNQENKEWFENRFNRLISVAKELWID